MCGICGIIDFKSHDTPWIQPVNYMMNALASRGPDAQGMYVQSNAVLGHRRLKIFDLSEKSQQPMVDNALGLAIVYNGAIYNYKEIRHELENQGYSFFSDGDTEVLLKSYHCWGKEAFSKLNGMFAFVIWHRDSGKVIMGRDRIGIKPLYYSVNSTRLAFASSIPALLAGECVDKEIDPVALHHYMTFHSVIPAPLTIFKGIQKLMPGTIMTFEADGKYSSYTYWNLDFALKPEEKSYTFDDWKTLLKHELEQAVYRRLVADVPVGVLLSGGLDSSLIVGLLANAGQNELNTFSVGFESVGGEKGDEFQYSDIIANHFSTIHHKIQVESHQVLSSLKACVKAMSEPMVSHDCIGFFLLSQEVSKHVKVVQSGQGADEVFAGYHWYPPLMTADNALDTYANVFFDGDHDSFSQIVHPRFVNSDYSKEFVNKHFAQSGAESAIQKALRLDTTVMLVDDPVKRVDNMTMAWGLEARVPFLDHKLVEFAARIPAEYKVKDGGKYILKSIGRDIIPSEVINRPKGYFPVPALKYFRGDYLKFVNEILNTPVARERQIFNRDYIDKVMQSPDDYITRLRGSRLWQMALLEYWLTVHNI